MEDFPSGRLVQPFDQSAQGRFSMISLARLDHLKEFPSQGFQFRFDVERTQMPLSVGPHAFCR